MGFWIFSLPPNCTRQRFMKQKKSSRQTAESLQSSLKKDLCSHFVACESLFKSLSLSISPMITAPEEVGRLALSIGRPALVNVKIMKFSFSLLKVSHSRLLIYQHTELWLRNHRATDVNSGLEYNHSKAFEIHRRSFICFKFMRSTFGVFDDQKLLRVSVTKSFFPPSTRGLLIFC